MSNNHVLQTGSRQIQLWPSLVRIGAMLWIFTYHFLVMLDIARSPFFRSIYAIMVFCFLSGYFSTNIQTAPHKWILKRYFRIMVPYWIVMVIMVIANYFVQYKQTTIAEIFIILSGGSLFVTDPLYIISWFITLILLLYATVYVYALIPSRFKWMFLALALYLSSLKPYASIYFVSFFLGFFFRKNLAKRDKCSTSKNNVSGKRSCLTGIKDNGQQQDAGEINVVHPITDTTGTPCRFSDKFASFFFKIQAYSYCFFLVHGAALHLFVKVMKGQPVKIFLLSFALSCVSSVVLYEVDKIIRGRMAFLHPGWS